MGYLLCKAWETLRIMTKMADLLCWQQKACAHGEVLCAGLPGSRRGTGQEEGIKQGKEKAKMMGKALGQTVHGDDASESVRSEGATSCSHF